MPDTVAFVDSIASSPTTRLDLNDGSVWGLNYEGTDMSPPPLRRAVAQTLLADGAQIPASAYDNRTLRLRLDNKSASVDAAFTQIQALMRELDRPTNILKWQPTGATNPVFFRTFRSDTNRIVEYPGTGTFRAVDIQILAEPFAYGLRESLGSFTIQGNPTAVGNMYIEISNTSIKGDVETPLIVSTDQEFSSVAARQVVFGAKRRTAAFDSAMTGWIQAESGNLGTDASLQSIANFSGGANTGVRVSFATATLQKRLDSNMPGGSDPQIRGRYRVYARVKKSIAADPVTMQLAWGNSGASAAVFNDAVTLPSTTSIVWVDLGDITVPYGADPVYDGYSGVELDTGGGYFEVWASRTSGTTNLEMDFFYFVPASDRLSLLSLPAFGNGLGPLMRWDGPNRLAFQLYPSDIVQELTPVPIVGADALMVSPGMYHRIWSLRDVTPGGAVTLNSTSYTLTYYPRYLYVRPATT